MKEKNAKKYSLHLINSTLKLKNIYSDKIRLSGVSFVIEISSGNTRKNSCHHFCVTTLSSKNKISPVSFFDRISLPSPWRSLIQVFGIA